MLKICGILLVVFGHGIVILKEIIDLTNAEDFNIIYQYGPHSLVLCAVR